MCTANGLLQRIDLSLRPQSHPTEAALQTVVACVTARGGDLDAVPELLLAVPSTNVEVCCLSALAPASVGLQAAAQ